MGNNVCTQLGIAPGKVISRNDLGSLWVMYEDEQGHLSRDNAKTFLQDFAKAAGVAFSPEIADKLITATDKENRGYLDYYEFQKLFFSVATKEMHMSLTKSLQLELDETTGEVLRTSQRDYLLNQPTAAANAELEDVWAVVSEALESFFERVPATNAGLRKSSGLGSTAKEWMSVYSTVYSYATSHSADVVGLYKRLRAYLQNNADIVAKRCSDGLKDPNFDILKFYLDEWEAYKTSVRKTNSILKVLSKFVSIKMPTQLSVLDLCWSQWETFFMFPLKNELMESFKKLVDKEGKTEDDTNRIKSLLESCLVLELPLDEIDLKCDIKPYLDQIVPPKLEPDSLKSSSDGTVIDVNNNNNNNNATNPTTTTTGGTGKGE
jgi:Ca2+-binding EF-hand superfamily protein